MKIVVNKEPNLVRREEVYMFRVSRQETEGSETMKTRPAVVISTNRLNKKKIRYVVVPITSKKFERVYDFEVPVMVEGKQGKALCDQIKIFSSSRIIGERIRTLKVYELKEIGEKILSLLDFEELIDLYQEIYQ